MGGGELSGLLNGGSTTQIERLSGIEGSTAGTLLDATTLVKRGLQCGSLGRPTDDRLLGGGVRGGSGRCASVLVPQLVDDCRHG